VRLKIKKVTLFFILLFVKDFALRSSIVYPSALRESWALRDVPAEAEPPRYYKNHGGSARETHIHTHTHTHAHTHTHTHTTLYQSDQNDRSGRPSFSLLAIF
jgi:hypothetical protein